MCRCFPPQHRNTLKPSVLSLTECHSFLTPFPLAKIERGGLEPGKRSLIPLAVDHVRPAFRFHQGDTSSSPSRTSRNSGPETAALIEPLCVASFTRSLIELNLCGVAR